MRAPHACATVLAGQFQAVYVKMPACDRVEFLARFYLRGLGFEEFCKLLAKCTTHAY